MSGLVRGNRRYGSDELRFTGIDMGGRRSRNKYAYQHSDDDNSLTDSDSQATDNDSEDDIRAEMERALVESALARIRKARARGKQDVKLNKGEVAALERRRKRLEAESATRRRGSDGKKRRDKEPRVAVSLSQFDAPLPGRGGMSSPDDAQSRHSSSSAVARSQGQPGPPIGMFAPPQTSHMRAQSPSSSQHSLSQRQGSSSPFDYRYVSTQRHASDSTRPPSSLKSRSHERDRRPSSSSSQAGLDPFQFQTAGPYVAPPGATYPPEDDEMNSDGGDGTPVDRNRSQDDAIVVEVEAPEPEYTRSRRKKTTSRPSSPKRKSISSGGGRRRKHK